MTYEPTDHPVCPERCCVTGCDRELEKEFRAFRSGRDMNVGPMYSLVWDSRGRGHDNEYLEYGQPVENWNFDADPPHGWDERLGRAVFTLEVAR